MHLLQLLFLSNPTPACDSSLTPTWSLRVAAGPGLAVPPTTMLWVTTSRSVAFAGNAITGIHAAHGDRQVGEEDELHHLRPANQVVHLRQRF